MKKIKPSGRLSVLLMLVFLSPIVAIAQTPPPADDPASAAAADTAGDTAVGSETAQPTDAPVQGPAMEAAAPDAASAKEHFESLPKPFFKHPFFMLLLFIIAVAVVWVLVRRRKAK